jgi:hypothetical protein
MIHYNPSVVFDTIKNQHDVELEEQSKQFVLYFYTFTGKNVNLDDVATLVKLYQSYSSLFDTWKSKDVKGLLEYYYKCYHELNIMLESVYNTHGITKEHNPDQKLDDVKLYESEIAKRQTQIKMFVQK